ncbi:MAG: HEAT repeat domain-containing protein [Bryobacterales bacterium]|nr:HEAT repeat domain-containing protein [Bryobacterales bacterium]
MKWSHVMVVLWAALGVPAAHAQIEPMLPSPVSDEIPLTGDLRRPDIEPPIPVGPPEPDYLPDPDLPDCRLQTPGIPVPVTVQGALVQQAPNALDAEDRWYRNGKLALERRQWDDAVAWFQKLIDNRSSRADASLYWKAYALHKLGRRQEARAAIEELQRSYPDSRWLGDAQALDLEMRQAAGRQPDPSQERDENLKLLAANGIVQRDPVKAVRVVEEVLASKISPPVKERALFVLAQSNSPEASKVLLRVARTAGNPDLQYKAAEYAGYGASGEVGRTLARLYTDTSDGQLKRAVVRGLTAARERASLVSIARADQSPVLRREAIRGLGTLGAEADLWQILQSEPVAEPRAEIARAIPVRRDNAGRFIEAAKAEEDPRAKREWIRQLGNVRMAMVTEGLLRIYSSSQDTSVRMAVLESLHNQNDARALVAIARSENNPQMKHTAVSLLARMQSKEAADYMMEASSK